PPTVSSLSPRPLPRPTLFPYTTLFRSSASHYSLMTKNTSAMFVAGPPVVARIGDKQQLSKQALGGWEIQCAAGAVDDAVDSEEEAFERARRFLSYLPSSCYDVAPRGARTDPPGRRE